jgi:hypothetical protein
MRRVRHVGSSLLFDNISSQPPCQLAAFSSKVDEQTTPQPPDPGRLARLCLGMPASFEQELSSIYMRAHVHLLHHTIRGLSRLAHIVRVRLADISILQKRNDSTYEVLKQAWKGSNAELQTSKGLQ